MVGKRLVHKLWYKFLSWLISNTFSHSFSVIWLLILSAVCSSSRSSLPPNYQKKKQTKKHLVNITLNVLGIRKNFNPHCVKRTRGFVGATLPARKASLYDSSLTPKAFSPLKPSASKPCALPGTRVLVSAQIPGQKKNKKSVCETAASFYSFHIPIQFTNQQLNAQRPIFGSIKLILYLE